METAALCKYLWCNISMWIDFPSSPSIKSATSSNRPPTPVRHSGRRKPRQEHRVPLALKVIVFLLNRGLRAATSFKTVVSCLSEALKLQSLLGFLSQWFVHWPPKWCDREVRCRSNYSSCAYKKSNFLACCLKTLVTSRTRWLCSKLSLPMQNLDLMIKNHK